MNLLETLRDPMSLLRIAWIFLLLFGTAGECQEPSAEPSKEWASLFNEQNLRGWVQRGGKSRFAADDQTIIGTTVPGEPTSYLCTETEFENFELMLEFKVDDPRLNSGIQIGGTSLAEYLNGAVLGYQVEIDPSDRHWTGAIYDEGRPGWLYKPDGAGEPLRAYKPGQWNGLRIQWIQSSLKTWVNEVPVADLKEVPTKKGFIGLQLHATEVKRPMTIRWRKIRIKEIER